MNIEKIKNQGAIALIMVIMITAITIVSSIVVSLVNISEKQANYHFSEAEEASVDMDACLDDALFRLASSSAISGTFNLDTASINCVYKISSLIDGGFKNVTSTASSTSDLGFWESEIIVSINVSTTPISINSYKNNKLAYSSYVWCGDASCSNGENCGTCLADCGACVCGDGLTQGAEVCDDGNTANEACGDGTKQVGTYCNATCSATLVLSEACDYTGALCSTGISYEGQVGCTKNPNCNLTCSVCVAACL
ncbi:MAG: hypothetical protein Q8O32_03275 [bacterium]|nr:hypothetical protein [bacterium]